MNFSATETFSVKSILADLESQKFQVKMAIFDYFHVNSERRKIITFPHCGTHVILKSITFLFTTIATIEILLSKSW